MARDDRNSGSVLVLICIECGKEYMFDSGEPAEDLTCEKCGNGVFRSFHAAARPDEASVDFRETTDRDLLTTDSGSDVTSGDLHDLNNL